MFTKWRRKKKHNDRCAKWCFLARNYPMLRARQNYGYFVHIQCYQVEMLRLRSWLVPPNQNNLRKILQAGYLLRFSWNVWSFCIYNFCILSSIDLSFGFNFSFRFFFKYFSSSQQNICILNGTIFIFEESRG